jgi:hypothetical protein
MSFAADLFDLLKASGPLSALVGSGAAARIYPVLAPSEVDRPYITWQRIASEPAEIGGRAGCERIGLQIDCWADTFDAAVAAGDAVRLAIEGSLGAVRGALESDADLYEDASRLYRRLQNFVIYHPAN